MFEYLDHLFQSAASTGAMIIVITTCVVVIYLLFNLSPIIENLIQRKMKKETVVVDNKEIHINVGNHTYEFQSRKIHILFWKLIGISYVIGFALGFAIIIAIGLVIIGIAWMRKRFKLGIFNGLKTTVLKIASPK